MERWHLEALGVVGEPLLEQRFRKAPRAGYVWFQGVALKVAGASA
ncbi:MAG TPA: hypothetical protein VFC18_18955 [Burkholderiales bacterium]|nr:hypothetical protein [Burkholderiales bacterium]